MTMLTEEAARELEEAFKKMLKEELQFVRASIREAFMDVNTKLDSLDHRISAVERRISSREDLALPQARRFRPPPLPAYSIPRRYHTATEYHSPEGGKRVRTGRYG